MLPEQAFRDAPHRGSAQRFVRLRYWAHLLREYRRSTKRRPNEKPHTLTGDEWRTAWAEAHDAQTDAVY